MIGYVADYLLYELDESGRTTFSEVLRGQEREALATLARERLRRCHAVEIWDGPMCIVRVQRRHPTEGSGPPADRSPD